MAKEVRRCIFCGEGKLSAEHIWPEWSHYLLERKQESYGALRTISDGPSTALKHKLVSARNKQGSVLNKRILCVCVKCNNGWMSQIENAAKPVLTKMILGIETALSFDDRHSVATWLCLKTMVWEYDDRDTRVTPQADRNLMFENRTPPPNWWIFTNSSKSKEWFTFLRHYGLSVGLRTDNIKAERAYNTRITTIGAGSMLAQTAVSYHPDGIDIMKAYAGDVGVPIIWPVVAESFTWPTPKVFGNVDAHRFANFLIDFFVRAAGRK